MMPIVRCPNCHDEFDMKDVLTAQSNQNVIFQCPSCKMTVRNIETSKG
jgi:NAD-dependent SIR2 family protein deacetylase